VVGAQPHLPGARSSDLHAKQQEMLSAMIARVFGADRQVVRAAFSQLVDLTDINVTFDGMHLKPEANAAVAAALVDPVIAASAIRQ